MASRKSFVFMKNFPVVTCNAEEGTLTRYTNSVTPTGGIGEGAAVYSDAMTKGNLVTLPDHTNKSVIIVKNAAAGADVVIGMVVAEPFGVDNTTVSGQTPIVSLQRKVDVALFGLGVVELTVSATGAVTPLAVVGFDDDEQFEVEEEAAAPTANGMLVALTYAAAGEKVAVLVGHSGYAPEV